MKVLLGKTSLINWISYWIEGLKRKIRRKILWQSSSILEKREYRLVRPIFLRRIVDRVKQSKGNLSADTNTLYTGHDKPFPFGDGLWKTDHGAVVGAPLLIADGYEETAPSRLELTNPFLDSFHCPRNLYADALIT